jgi:hypothetical protein
VPPEQSIRHNGVNLLVAVKLLTIIIRGGEAAVKSMAEFASNWAKSER